KWREGACGSCVLTTCSRESALCDAEPSCSKHAQCVEKCPADDQGNVDRACLAACPLAEGTAGTRARAAYDTCVTSRGPGQCAACTKPESPSTSAVLNQTCGASPETNACYKCEDERCCKTFQGCVDVPECKQQLQPCIVACGSDAACKS